MLLLSTDHVPMPHKIEAVFNMIEITYRIQISNKGLIRGLMEKGRNEHEEALEYLMKAAPQGANAIVGIKASSAAQTFNDGTFLYLTYIGTPINFVEID